MTIQVMGNKDGVNFNILAKLSEINTRKLYKCTQNLLFKFQISLLIFLKMSYSYGKCNFGDLETGRKCGCLRYCVTKSIRPDEDDLCKCKHYECFHEEIE